MEYCYIYMKWTYLDVARHTNQQVHSLEYKLDSETGALFRPGRAFDLNMVGKRSDARKSQIRLTLFHDARKMKQMAAAVWTDLSDGHDPGARLSHHFLAQTYITRSAVS